MYFQNDSGVTVPLLTEDQHESPELIHHSSIRKTATGADTSR